MMAVYTGLTGTARVQDGSRPGVSVSLWIPSEASGTLLRMDGRAQILRWRRGHEAAAKRDLATRAGHPVDPAESLRRGLELIALAEALASPVPPGLDATREREDAVVRARWIRLRRALR